MSNKRFTKNGSPELERQLANNCQRILSEVLKVVPKNKLEALVLGGGYGRGEGGVLRTKAGDQPYNDLEFYVFVTGNRLLNQRAYAHKLQDLGESLSPGLGLHVEFKIDSLTRFKHSTISIFSYDLAAGHQIIFGDQNLFADCPQHQDPTAIPLSEGSRLLFNRCSGLLLAREILENPGLKRSGQDSLDADQSDFVGRNLAKAQLCLGDSVLVAFGKYHWSCIERKHRVLELTPTISMPWFKAVQTHHSAGVEFKLEPRRILKSVEEFERERCEMGALALKVWLWLESQRLGCKFESARDYAFHGRIKCPGTSFWRNYLLNLRSFGAKAALAPLSLRYPRERLLNALSLLLWNSEIAKEPLTIRLLQRQLSTQAADWSGLVTAYKKIWTQYG